MTMPPDGKSWSTFLREARLQVQHAGRNFTSGFTWDNFFATLRTLAWLTPLTILIWVYAEREQTETVDNIAIPIQISAGGDVNLFVEPQPPNPVVTARLTGPRGRLEDIRQRIMPKEGNATVIINIDRNHVTPGGLQTLDTAAALSTNQIFANSGVTVSNCSPTQLKVFVDEYKQRELEVQRPTGITNLVGTPSFDPRKVTIRAPQRNLQTAEPITVEADLNGLVDTPGPQVVNNVPLIVRPRIENVTFEPSTVRATFEVRATDVKMTYRSMGVSVDIPQSMQMTQWVKAPQTLANVELIGPPDQIAFLQQETVKPTARISVTIDALPGKTYTAKPGANLTFEFPAGAKDVRVNPETISDYSIEWTLMDRTTPES
jgi:hypothetical protein